MEILDALMVVFSLETITMILLGVFAGDYYRRITGFNSEYGHCTVTPTDLLLSRNDGDLIIIGNVLWGCLWWLHYRDIN